MMLFLEKAQKLLIKKKAALVLWQEGQEPFISYDSGLRPLFLVLEQGNWQNAFLADKVIGKAAAFLAVKAEVKGIYTPVISDEALIFLQQQQLLLKYDQVVPYILNASREKPCGMEKLLKGPCSLEQGYQLIKDTFNLGY